MQAQTGTQWTRRIERAKSLRTQIPSALELLSFYEGLLELQSRIFAELAVTPADFPPGISFRDRVNLEIPAAHLGGVNALANRHGKRLVYSVSEVEKRGHEHARDLMSRQLMLECAPSSEPTSDRFLALALLQPAMEYVAGFYPANEPPGNRCPKCDSLPVLAVLRPQGEGAKRWLHCSMCLSEWPFRRVLCAWCGETDMDKLPRFTADECNYVRIEACDTCKRYLKSIDLTADGYAVPMVDEIALAALDIWAQEHGFTKISPNLFGM